MTTAAIQQHEPSFDDAAESLAARFDGAHDIERADVSAVAVLNRSEVEAQLDAAHKHHRQVKRFLQEAATLATLTQEVAQSCIYALPRDGKTIAGPSVRLAEIVASAYGNLHVAARVVDVEDTVVVAQGVAWDLEKNLRATIEVRRRITDKRGRRFSDDMINVTGNAAASIALRNAIFRVVPRAYVDTVYAQARRVAVGDARTLADRRAAVLANFEKLGVTRERVLEKVGKAAVEDVGLEELEVLIGLGTAIRSGDLKIEDAFAQTTNAKAQASEETKALEDQLRQKPAPTPPAAPTRDFAAEAEVLKKQIAEAAASGDKAKIAAVRVALDTLTQFPPDIAKGLLAVYATAVAPKKEEAPEPKKGKEKKSEAAQQAMPAPAADPKAGREPGEEG